MTYSEEHQQIDVTVCICTFRRPSLSVAIQSVLDQVLPPSVSMRVTVIDNDTKPTAQAIVNEFDTGSETPIDYKHAPAQNISIARNAGVEACTTPWLAFVDDDEYAASDWLANLITARTNANCIFGQCTAIYRDNAPAWIKAGDYHSNRITVDSAPIDTGYTSNVLIDMKLVRELDVHFDTRLGRSGGEDTIFFHEIYRKGGRFHYAPDAIVYENVPISRISINWVAARKYRAGQVYALMFKTFDKMAYRRLQFFAPFKVVVCVGASLVMIVKPSRAMWWIMRSIFHFGSITFGLTGKIHQEYRHPS